LSPVAQAPAQAAAGWPRALTAPGAPTDPDMQDYCIRLVSSELRCVSEHGVDGAR